MELTVKARDGGPIAVDIRGHEIVVDVPADAEGSDAGPTATELFVAGLAACVAYYAEIFLRRHGLPTQGLEVGCRFSMSDDRPARVASIDLDVPVPGGFESQWQEPLQRVLEHCAVHNSLRQPPDVRIRIAQPALAGV